MKPLGNLERYGRRFESIKKQIVSNTRVSVSAKATNGNFIAEISQGLHFRLERTLLVLWG